MIAWVQSALRESLVRPADGRVARFDSVFPVAMLDDMRPELFDWIFVDETQDMDTAQLTVVQKSVAPGGRVAVVGDGKQAIYGFRGADVKAMSRMESALAATRLPLSVSYRVRSALRAWCSGWCRGSRSRRVRPKAPASPCPRGRWCAAGRTATSSSPEPTPR
nr:UvrD-helicase domain-containing protein [Deltaproteobacteria bacterium]